MNSKTSIPPRLFWACRRGMLELDVLLGKFLKGAYIHSSSEEQDIFTALLECTDQELFEWLTKRQIPADPNFRQLIEKIINFSRKTTKKIED